MRIAVRVAFQGTRHADNIKQGTELIAVPFSLLYQESLLVGLFWIFFCKMALSSAKIGTIKESVLIE